MAAAPIPAATPPAMRPAIPKGGRTATATPTAAPTSRCLGTKARGFGRGQGSTRTNRGIEHLAASRAERLSEEQLTITKQLKETS